MQNPQKHYPAIDGLRTIAAFGIAMMHIAANTRYDIHGFIYETVIHSFTNFVFLFMTISAFGMCCGYYDKILNSTISVSDFYGKRYKKIWPFFAALVLLDLIISRSTDALFEAFADLTLLFGFLPGCGNITVIGVAWFLGLIFVFYISFPFFCWLIENKRRAWFMFVLSLVWTFACADYFDVRRTNILYCGCFFLAGGIIFLYRDAAEKLNKQLVLLSVILAVSAYYITGENFITALLVSCTLLLYSIVAKVGVLANRFTKFFGGISMEIYLSHMVMFRVVEKLRLTTILGDGRIQYLFTVFIVLLCTSLFAVIMKRIIRNVTSKISVLSCRP
ncbi:MAG: acyltransferase [Synergistes sp.]|nr:acyltransferase [Synergistes sp.]